MPEPDYEALLRRRRIWGVPPDAVEQVAMECERTQAELRTRLRELEVRLAHVTAQRDEATQSATALREQVERLEREHGEVAGRPDLVREEALRFVIDAWAEAQTIREQTRQEIERAEATAREQVAAVRQTLVKERERHEAEITMLRERRQKAIAALESLAEGLLSQATRGTAPKQPEAASEAAESDPSSPAPLPEPATANPTSDSDPVTSAPPRTNGGNGEDQLLAKALDNLEAILSTSRKANGAG